MRATAIVLSTTVLLTLCASLAMADKQTELEQYRLKPWRLTDLPQVQAGFSGATESEPNNDCPGNPYVLGSTFEGAINPGGDQDWVFFDCNADDILTIGTDAVPGAPTVDTVIELYLPGCGAMIAFNDDGGPGLYSLIDGFVMPVTGTYHLKIRGFSQSSVGSYVLQGNCQPGNGTGDCPLVGYKGVTQQLDLIEIPDNDPTGLTFGPIVFPADAATILDVVVDIEMEHTWIGDLVITLQHIDGSGASRTVDLLQRPGVPQSTFGCSGDMILGLPYYFGTMGAMEPMGEFDCPAVLPFACYQVAVENAGGLEQWAGLPKDGTWWLHVSDHAAGDVGIIAGWSVHLLNEPIATPVESASWGAIKAVYK